MSVQRISPPITPSATKAPSLGQTIIMPDPSSSSQHAPVLPAQTLSSVASPPTSRYEPVRQIGEGGMGEVLLSRDPTIGRQVAIKRLKRQPDTTDAAAARFMAEVQTTGRLEHPGIVPIYDAGQDAEGTPYFVMKYVEGEPLNQVIAKLRAGDPDYEQRYSYEHRTQMFMQLLRAVQYAHHQGVLHLDVKPANVIIGPFGEVVLVDWGISRAKPVDQDSAKTQLLGNDTGALTGTPDYMAPEQAMGKTSAIGRHTDTYCLSVLFYELITLHYYLPAKTTLAGRVTSILIDEPLTGLQMHHRFGAPPELTNYIHYGLNKDPEKRYQTVDEMVEMLQLVMDGLIPVVCPCTAIKRSANGYGDFMNAHPNLAIAGVSLIGLITFWGLFDLVRRIISSVT